MKNKILFILITILTVVSCRKDDISDGQINQPPTPLVVYELDLVGSVVDQNGKPLADVQMSSGQNIVITDVNGLFKINDLSVDGTLGSYISADIDGYFSGGDRIYAGGTHSRQIEITLVQKELSGYVNSTKEGSISLQNGLKIDFPANGFTSNGNDYQGLVSVYAYHLDPSEEGFLDRSPGDLSGTDELNNTYILESFGMLAVEMETTDGQPVQLKEGFPSTITVPVDASLLSDAPAELPLWHFDDDLHKWVMEGTAELVNGSYIGQVTHFSWWNCDDFLNSALLCLQVVDSRFLGSMQGLIIELHTQSQGSSIGITDTEGFVSGVVPASESISFDIYDNCGNIVSSGDIGPVSGNNNKVVIPVVLSDLALHEFAGTVYDCESMTLLEGAFIRIQIGESNYFTETNENGEYNYFVLACDESVEYGVTAYSIIDGASGFIQTTGLASTGEINVVDINLCNESTFVVLKNVVHDDETIIAKRKPNETIIFSDGPIPGHILIGFYGSTIGTFPAFITSVGPISSTNCTVTITQFDDVGGIVKGTIQGTTDNDGESFDGLFVANVVE